MSHLREVETQVGKPLLLEEFGKKLAAAEYANGSILAKRDPIFQSMYTAVEGAIASCVLPPSLDSNPKGLVLQKSLPRLVLDKKSVLLSSAFCAWCVLADLST